MTYLYTYGKTMLTAQIEPLSVGIEELKTLLPTHYGELSEHYKQGICLNPDYKFYLDREKNGQLLYVTLRQDGKLEGYFVGFITNCLHYQTLTLSLDIIYVTPNARGLNGGVMLMKAIKKEFDRRGIRLWKMGLKEAHREHMEKLLLSFGFKPFERTYAMWAEQ